MVSQNGMLTKGISVDILLLPLFTMSDLFANVSYMLLMSSSNFVNVVTSTPWLSGM